LLIPCGSGTPPPLLHKEAKERTGQGRPFFLSFTFKDFNPMEEYIDFDPEELDSKFGGDVVMPGFYVGIATDIRMQNTRKGEENIVFSLRVATANKGKESEIGKTHEQWVPTNSKPGNSRKRSAFARALGLTTNDALRSARESGTPLKYEWQEAVGRAVCMLIEEDEDQDGKPKFTIRFNNVYHIDSKDARRFPVDHKAIEAARVRWEQEECDPWDKERKEAGSAAAPASSVASGKEEAPFDPFA
jgi:hypothetical protein